MKILNEDTIKKMHNNNSINEIQIEKDTLITKKAKEYLENNGINLNEGKTKAEHLTHLYGKEMVIKNHPRIIMRGKLDTFQADLLMLQVEAKNEGQQKIVDLLQEVLSYSRKILACEVTGKPFGKVELFSMNEKQLREASQNPRKFFGVDHIAPSLEMGKLAIGLNQLRAKSREVELAAITAFCPHGNMEREDIIQALNRLSSAIYIIFCRTIAENKE